jgi:hypothetical protein
VLLFQTSDALVSLRDGNVIISLEADRYRHVQSNKNMLVFSIGLEYLFIIESNVTSLQDLDLSFKK